MSAIPASSRQLQPVQMRRSFDLVKRHAVIAYWVLALAFSWLIWLPLIIQAQGWANLQVPFAVHYLGAFGPLLSSVIVTWLMSGRAGLTELWSRIVRWRVGWLGWLAGGLPIGLFALAAVITIAIGNPPPALALLGQVNYLPYLGVLALPFWFVTYGLGEESGWRGFALPRLQNGRSALRATLILWIMWALWHIPAFFYLDTYRALGLGMFPLFALGLLAGAIVFTWIYNTTGGSVLIAALYHALFNLFTATEAADGTMQMVMSILVMVWAVVIVVVYKPANLSRQPEQVI